MYAVVLHSVDTENRGRHEYAVLHLDTRISINDTTTRTPLGKAGRFLLQTLSHAGLKMEYQMNESFVTGTQPPNKEKGAIEVILGP